VHDLSRLVARVDAQRIAEGIAAMIDGLYIRRALKQGEPDAASAIRLVENHLEIALARVQEVAGRADISRDSAPTARGD
jgi:hypothetical protein